jgi:hypothetical protein
VAPQLVATQVVLSSIELHMIVRNGLLVNEGLILFISECMLAVMNRMVYGQ